MYRRPKFLEILDEIREEMSREADYDADYFAELLRSGMRSGRSNSVSPAGRIKLKQIDPVKLADAEDLQTEADT